MASELGYQFTFGAKLAPSFKGAMSAAQSQVAGLAQRVRRLESSDTGRLGGAFEAQRRKIAGFGKELREAQEQLRGLWNRAEAAGTMSATMARQIEQAERRVAGLTQSLRRSSAAYREHVAGIRTAEGSVGNLRRKYQALSADMDRARRSQAALSANLAQKAALRDERADLQGRLVGTAMTGVAAAMPVKLAISAEDTFADLRKVMDAPESVMEQVFADAQEMSNRTGKSFEDIITIMTAAAQAGLGKTREELLAVADQAVTMSIAWGVSAEQAGKSLASWQAAMGMTADESRHTADVINALSNSMNAEAGEIDSIFTRLGPLMRGTGFASQSIAALATAFKSAGAEVEVSGTAMKNFVKVMAAGSAGLTDARIDIYKQLRIDPDELQRQLQTDAEGAVMRVLEALEKVAPEERNSIASRLFGEESVAAIAPLMTNIGLLRQAFKIANSDVSGSAQQEYQNRMKTTATALAQLSQSTRNLGVTVGMTLLPVVGAVARGLTKVTGVASNLAGRFPRLTAALMAGAAAAGSLAIGGLVLGYAFNTVRTGLVMARGAMLLFSGAQMATTGTTRALTLSQGLSRLATMSWRGALIGGRAAIVGLAGRVAAFAGIQRGATLGTVAFTVAQKGMAAGAAIAGGGLRVLGMAVRFALGPLGLILTALSIGVGLIIDNWDTVGPYFTAVWDGITGTFRAAWDFIRGIIDKVAAGIGWIGEQIDKIPVLGSAKRGLGAAWDWAFGEDEDSESAPESPSASAAPLPAAPQAPSGQAQQALMSSSAASPSVGQAVRPAPSSSGTAGLVNVPQRAAAHNAAPRSRQASASQRLDLEQLSPMAGTNISMDMQFQVQGLDSAVFRQKINECRKDFEAIVRRVVDDMQHQKTRTAYAQ